MVYNSILHQSTYHNLVVLKHKFDHTESDMSTIMREYKQQKMAGTIKVCELLYREDKIQALGAPYSVYEPD